jgi:hypothetical protein
MASIWSNGSDLSEPRKSIGQRLYDHNGIESEEGQIGQIVFTEAFTAKVGMQQAKTPQSPRTGTVSL